MNTTVEVVVDKDPGARLALTGMRASDGRHFGPMAHISAERARLDSTSWHLFDVERMSATIGAVLHGVDLCADLSEEMVADIQRALDEFKVVFFRDQPMSPAQHVAVASRFGDLEIHPFIPSNTGHPELVRFAKSAEVGGYENQWHHDVTWREVPSASAMLHAIEVPAIGGDTLFSDMHAAYDGLTDEVKAQIESLDATHDFMPSFGRAIPPDKLAEMHERYPAQHHPVVARHARTGRQHLYVNQTFVERIDGLGDGESARLISLLCEQAKIPEYQCRFRWEKDSVAFWDNRAVQHYAASDYWPDVRVMERASIVGSRPTR